MQVQESFVKQLKQRFDDSVQGLDAGTAGRIARVRERALEGGHRRRSKVVYRVPAGALAVLCLAVIVYALLPQDGQPQSPPPSAMERMELISELDLYEELEFYLWLERHELPS